jgi:hypothetical protein
MQTPQDVKDPQCAGGIEDLSEISTLQNLNDRQDDGSERQE